MRNDSWEIAKPVFFTFCPCNLRLLIIETFDAAKLWFKGKHYNLPFLDLLVLAYQALIYHNFMQGSENLASVKPIIQEL